MFRYYNLLTTAFLLQSTLNVNCFNDSFATGHKYEEFDKVSKELKKVFPIVIEGDGYTEYRTLHGIPLKRLSFQRDVPDYFDWRSKNMVSPVKQQGDCGACWAFAVVGALECHVKIHTNQEFLMSESFLIDCIKTNDGYPHCSTFTILKTYGIIVSDFGGVLKQQDYRTYDESYRSCGYTKPPPSPVAVIGFLRVQNNEDEMVKQLFQQGPLTAAINSKAMKAYKGDNVIDEPTEEQCSSAPADLDHSVVIVGYNIYVGGGRKVPYWIIKNSWGQKWGSDGYYYLVRGRNACGIANDVSFPIVGK